MGSIRGTTKSRGRKDELDRFYTDISEAKKLVSHLIVLLCGANKTTFNANITATSVPGETEVRAILAEMVADGYIFVEPSAGDGAFLAALEYFGVPTSSIVAGDIAPADNPLCHTKIEQCDYLAIDTKSGRGKFDEILEAKTPTVMKDKTIVVGNPPFGEQGTLCYAFLKRSFMIADTVAFILPPSFSKESVLRKVGRKLVDTIPVENDGYRISGGTKQIPSMFVIYDGREEYTPRTSRLDDLPFIFLAKSKSDLADFTIRRVGGNAGTASEDVDVSVESNYFCRMRDDASVTLDEVINVINSASFDVRDRTVGPRSLSRDEIAWEIADNF